MYPVITNVPFQETALSPLCPPGLPSPHVITPSSSATSPSPPGQQPVQGHRLGLRSGEVRLMRN